MYARAIVEETLEELARPDQLGPVLAQLPGGRLTRYSTDDRRALVRQLNRRSLKTGELSAPLTQEEELFILNERILTKWDFEYWATGYAMIIRPDEGLSPLYPLWESQQLILQEIGKQELERRRIGHPDGLLFNILKGRQLGASTLCQSMLAHRVTTQSYTFGLIASDVPQNSGSTGLFGKLELTVAQLPWWLRPRELFHEKNQHIVFANEQGEPGSSIIVESGKSMKGALQDEGGSKGQLGRSKTYSIGHLSELSTWENAGQIDDALLPAVPQTMRTLLALESTAKGKGNWWHKQWETTSKGLNRFFNIFIPWYAERSKNWRPAPSDWIPDEDTLAYANRVEQVAPRFMQRRYRLTREQLYWYYTERRNAVEKGTLYKFLEEQPAEPADAFQYSGRSIFTPAVLDDLRNKAKPVKAVWAVEPTSLITEVRTIDAEERAIAAATDSAQVRAARPPLPKKLARITDDPWKIPPGYGFRPVKVGELREQGLLNWFQIWEHPLRGYTYCMSADVADGLGLDRSVIDVFRMGTIERGEEQVAQFISDCVKPRELAFICDAIGRLYCNDDGLEALAAIELNAHGGTVQDSLQLHLGYNNFYVWEVIDARNPSSRFSQRIGWMTTPRTRPLILTDFHEAVLTLDETTGERDLQINSTFTIEDMSNLVIPEGGRIGDAEAGSGGYDDCVLSAAINHYVLWRQAGGEREPLAEARRRWRTQEWMRRHQLEEEESEADFRNMPYTADESGGRIGGEKARQQEELEELMDVRAVIYEDW